MKRFLCLVIVFASIVAGLAWSAGQSEEGTAETGLDKHYDISFGWFGERDFSDDPVYDIVSDKFNVDIKIVSLTWGEHDAQVNLMVASGDMPDAVFFAGSRGQYIDWARTGVIREIPTFPDSRYPNLSTMWDKMPRADDIYMVDDKLYAWPKYLAQNPAGNWWPTGFLYRADWARKLGMYKEQYTVDKMMELAIAFADRDPGNNGAGRTVGYGDNTQWSYIVNAYNTYASHFYRKNGEFIWGARESSTLEGIKAFKRLYDTGAYWQDFFAGKDGDIVSMFQSGLAGIVQGNFNSKSIGKTRAAFEDATGRDFMESVEYMDVLGPDGKRWAWEMTNIWSASIFDPKLSDQKLHRIMTVMDWFATEEAVNTLFFGVPGEDWVMQDGEPVHRWETNEKGLPQAPGYDSRMLITMTQLEETYTWFDPSQPPGLLDMVLDHLKRLGENVNFRRTDPLLVTFTGENWLKHGQSLAWTEYYDTIKRIIPSTTIDTIGEEYKAWLREVKPRADAVPAELNAAR